MDKPVNNRAWFLVVPVVAIVAFNAVLPLMTVINYSVQDTFGNNQFFWNGVGWYKDLLDPSSELGGRFLASLVRNAIFSLIVLLIEVRRWASLVSLCMPKKGRGVAFCLVIMALPLLVPWNVVGTIWQIFARSDIGLLGWTLNHLGIDSRHRAAQAAARFADRRAAAIHGQLHDLYRTFRRHRRRSWKLDHGRLD